MPIFEQESFSSSLINILSVLSLHLDSSPSFIPMMNRYFNQMVTGKSPQQYPVKIHIWELDPNSTVGHAAVELPPTPKTATSTYFSLRPDSVWGLGPIGTLTGAPVIGKTVDYGFDCHYEDKAPDRTITLLASQDDTEKMRTTANRFANDIKERKMKYSIMLMMTAYRLYFLKLFTQSKTSDASHCSDSVRRILLSGGVNIPLTGHKPWMIDPTELGNELERLNCKIS